METDNYIFFYGHNPNKKGTEIYSQWFPSIFYEEIDNKIIQYFNAEQYMMAHKALLFEDFHNYKKFMKENNPSKVKKAGRRIKNFNEDLWNDYKYDIVVSGNKLKFEQNPDLLEKLLKTGNKLFVESSPYDYIWGIGMSANEAIKLSENKWPGKNLLGKAITQVRNELNI
ncbi:hypothetical protein QJ854_gp707 [Moumouvirus goulette]|uniref:NADAR domain-containing protein n=1 Tax=Moumouvirus goulette TaxID=1247379 RepID=M1NM31_9VIRU|nr:hypothetical protein QJ854_gp707 [Moumouvirus goulette]AGF85075.1 hypothetical protein glt_00266 [Moumouvirus goulette]